MHSRPARPSGNFPEGAKIRRWRQNISVNNVLVILNPRRSHRAAMTTDTSWLDTFGISNRLGTPDLLLRREQPATARTGTPSSGLLQSK